LNLYKLVSIEFDRNCLVIILPLYSQNLEQLKFSYIASDNF